jgi:hypothetical protein
LETLRDQSQGGLEMPQKTDQRTPPGNGEDLLQQAKETTRGVVDQVEQKASSRVERGKDEVANELGRVAGSVRQLGEQLGTQDQGPISHYAAEYGRKAAEGLDRLSNYLRQTDGRELVREVEKLGRRQPALLLGGAFLLGLAGARLLKSSMPTNESDTNLGRGLPPPPPRQPSHVQTTSAAL